MRVTWMRLFAVLLLWCQGSPKLAIFSPWISWFQTSWILTFSSCCLVFSFSPVFFGSRIFFLRTGFLGPVFFGAAFFCAAIILGLVALSAVVGHIPAAAFELDIRCVLDLLKRAAALGAFLDWPVRKLLDLFEFVFALLTLIFVQRHAAIPSKLEVVL